MVLIIFYVILLVSAYNARCERVITLLVEELINDFKKEKKHTPSHANELLDYLQKQYIYGEVSILQYKKLFAQLDKLKAEKPTEFFIVSKPFNLTLDIPS